MKDPDPTFFRQLVSHHVSGQLKVAPEHCSLGVLTAMGKPNISVYEEFRRKYFALSEEFGLEQYLVPYLMSSHPGSTMKDAVELALWLKKYGYSPEQVQDFYPTPGTVSTVAYYTGINPLTNEKIHVTRDYKEKQMQRALLQYTRPENAPLVREALRLAHREDLIGSGPECLVSSGSRAESPRPRTEGRSSFGGQYIPQKSMRSKKEGGKGHKGKGQATEQKAATPFPRKKPTSQPKGKGGKGQAPFTKGAQGAKRGKR